MSDSVVCLWLLVVQSLDRCHWRLLSGRQILLARSAVSVMISLSLSLSLSLDLHVSLSLALSQSLSLSLTPPPPTHTHFVSILCVSLSGTSVHLHGCAVTVFCSASLLIPLDTTQTLASTEEQPSEKETVSFYFLLFTMLTDTTKRNINFDLEEQGKETSKLGD